MIYVAYRDGGPTAIGGQTCDRTSPWNRLYRFDDRDRAVAFVEAVNERRNGRRRPEILGWWSDDEMDGMPLVHDMLGRLAEKA